MPYPTYEWKWKGSVKYQPEVDFAEQAKTLHDAMDGAGTNEDEIVNTLGKYPLSQRLELAEQYKQAYGEDLINDLKSDLSGDIENVLVSMLTDHVDLDCKELHEAMSGGGTNETALIEILATKTNAELEVIKERYKEMFESDLEADIRGDCSGDFERFLVAILTGGRQEDDLVDEAKAEEDANALNEAGPLAWGTDEGAMNAIFCLRSISQLKATFIKFEEIVGKTIEEVIDDELSGHLQEGFQAIIDITKDMQMFWAKRINKCCKGAGTKDDSLIRIIVSRSEIDMWEIKQWYLRLYEMTLADQIQDECSGDYKKLLLGLINEPEEE